MVNNLLDSSIRKSHSRKKILEWKKKSLSSQKKDYVIVRILLKCVHCYGFFYQRKCLLCLCGLCKLLQITMKWVKSNQKHFSTPHFLNKHSLWLYKNLHWKLKYLGFNSTYWNWGKFRFQTLYVVVILLKKCLCLFICSSTNK